MKMKTKILIGTVVVFFIIGISLVPINICTKTIENRNFELSIPDDSQEWFHFDFLRGGYNLTIIISFLDNVSSRVTIDGFDGYTDRWYYEINYENIGVYNLTRVDRRPLHNFVIALREGGDVNITVKVETKPIILNITLGTVSGVIVLLGLMFFLSVHQIAGKHLSKLWLKVSPTLLKPINSLRERREDTRKKKQLKREEEEAKRLQEQSTKEGLASGKLLSCPSCGTGVQVDDENCSGCNLRIEQFEPYKEKMRNR